MLFLKLFLAHCTKYSLEMARTMQTSKRSTGGEPPRRSLASQLARNQRSNNNNMPEDKGSAKGIRDVRLKSPCPEDLLCGICSEIIVNAVQCRKG